jgi:ribonuclease VapC
MSAASYLEAAVIVDRRGGAVAQQFLDQVIKTLRIEIVPFTLGQALWARSAYRRFGKGSGHPAQLNFGDCMSYALAAERRQPILFKGGDFTQTDLEPAF